jgi:hypothetical protein
VTLFSLCPGIRLTTEEKHGKPQSGQFVYIIFKNSVRTAKKTPHFTVTKINRLTLFTEIIAVYAKNRSKYTIQNAASLIVKLDGTQSYHWTLRY